MGALFLGAVTDRGAKTDNRGLAGLLAGLSDGVVDGLEVTVEGQNHK